MRHIGIFKPAQPPTAFDAPPLDHAGTLQRGQPALGGAPGQAGEVGQHDSADGRPGRPQRVNEWGVVSRSAHHLTPLKCNFVRVVGRRRFIVGVIVIVEKVVIVAAEHLVKRVQVIEVTHRVRH
jgi:hypothetical protein